MKILILIKGNQPKKGGCCSSQMSFLNKKLSTLTKINDIDDCDDTRGKIEINNNTENITLQDF